MESAQADADSPLSDVDSLSVRAPRDGGEGHAETQEIDTKERVGGIEILVQMAAKGEIDPKNIDIIDVCDRFLQAIASVPKENLRQSGKILFHASVLLRMKAESLLVDNVQDLDGGDDFSDFDADGSPIFYDANNEPIARQITLQDLERALVRRSHNKQFRQRRVTLEQLIDALKEAEHLERERVTKKPKARIDLEGQAQVQDFGDILDLAHDEDIDAIITRAEIFLVGCFATQDRMSIVDFLRHLGSRNDWVDAFLAVLFLSNAGKIVLEQERFYGPLFLVRPGDANNEAANGTAAAPKES